MAEVETSPPVLERDPPIVRPQRSLRALQGLRVHIRRAFLIDGALAVGLVALFLVILAFFLDYFLVLPPGVRAVHLTLSLTYLCGVLVLRLLRPRNIRLREEDLAVLVEARSPGLSQALITAVELTRPDHRGARFLSREMIDQVVRKAEEACSSIDPRRVLDFRGVRRNAFLFSALFVAMATGALLRPDLAGIWFRRLFLLSKDGWPKSTELELVRPLGNPVRVALGEDLAIEARARRGAPAKVEVEAEWEDGGRWRDPMAESAQGVYHKLFENVSRDFRFRVLGGDDELPEVEVRVWIQPSLSQIDAWYRYPEHTGLPTTPPEKPVRNPSLITLPAGTEVAFRAFTDLPIKQAYFVFKPREELDPSRPGQGGTKRSQPAAEAAPWPEPGALQLTVGPAGARPAPLEPKSPDLAPPGNAASMFEGSFKVERDGSFFFQLLTMDDVPGRKGKIIGVRSVPDRKPAVRITKPTRSSEEVSPEAIVPMEFSIRDDYGVKSATLETVVMGSGGEPEKPQSIPLELEDRPPEGKVEGGPTRAREYRPSLTIDLQKVAGITAGSRFQYYVRAEDFGGNSGESERYVLHVLSKQDIDRLLKDRLMVLRDQLREIGRQQESARKDLQTFQREQKSPLDASTAAKLSRFRQDQERVTSSLGRTVKEFDQLLAKMEANKVGEEKEKAWLSGLRGDVEALATQSSTQVEKMIDELKSEAAKAPQSLEQVSPIVEKEQKLERDIQTMVMRLSEFGDLNAVIIQLREIQVRQEEIRKRTRERLQGGGTPADSEGEKGTNGEGTR